MDSHGVPEPNLPPKVLLPPKMEGMSPVKLLLDKPLLTSGHSAAMKTASSLTLPATVATSQHMESNLQMLAVSTMLPHTMGGSTSTSPVPGPSPASTPLSPPVGGGPSQTSHRSRKEKLIVRSDADNIEVQGTAMTTATDPEPSVPAESEPELLALGSASPTKTKKPESPTKGDKRSYRRKHASESDKKRESLSKKVLVSNAQRRVGLGQEQPKKASKRRNTVSGSEIIETSAVVNESSSSAAKPELIKSPSPKKKSGRGSLTPQEEALLPILLKGHVPRTTSNPSVPVPTSKAALPSSQTHGDKRLDLRLQGLSNVLPIFKPNQKPWNLLKQLLENTEDAEARKRAHLANSAEPVFDVKEEPMEQTASIKPHARSLQNLNFWDSDDSESDEDSDESSSSTDTANEECSDDVGELEAIAVPVDIQGDQVNFSSEAISLLDRFLSPLKTKQGIATVKEQAKNRVRSESESSLPGFNPSVFPPPLLPRPASTPAAGYSESETPNLRDFDQNLSRSTEFQFRPLDAPVSPGGINSKWSWGKTGRESPFGGVSFSRFQAASPSGSSTNGNSGRRYSRRRHSRMYPPFETSHCMYTKHFCAAPLEPGSTYCIKHVSEKYSPYYVRCAFVSSKTGRRCQNMQYSRDGKNKFCNMHASRLALLRQKLYRKPRPTKHVKDYMNEMRHVQKKLERPKRTEAAAYLEDYCDYKLQTQCMENEVEVVDPIEEMNLTVEDMCKYQVEHDSDGGCDLDDEYECLKNAGYYTTEEVVRILKSKLSKLKELYVKEFDFLKLYYLLKRQEYLMGEDKLRSSGLKVSRNPKTLFKWNHLVTPEFIKREMKTYEKTKVLLNYHRLRGQTAVLHHLAKKRYEEQLEASTKDNYPDETDSEGENPIITDVIANAQKTKEKPPKPERCSFDDGIITCHKAPLPASDLCHQHILKDERQVLFQPCSYPTDDNEYCQIPLLKKLRRSGCDFHRLFRLKRFMKSSSERKTRNQLLKSLPNASFKEHVKMLEDLVASKIGSVEEFDREVDYILSKGLDLSDTSISDNENDYDFQLNDDDEDEDEPSLEPNGGRRKRPHGNRGRRKHFGPFLSKRQRLRMDNEGAPSGVDSPAELFAPVVTNGNIPGTRITNENIISLSVAHTENSIPVNGESLSNGVLSLNGEAEHVLKTEEEEIMKVSNGCLPIETLNGEHEPTVSSVNYSN